MHFLMQQIFPGHVRINLKDLFGPATVPAALGGTLISRIYARQMQVNLLMQIFLDHFLGQL